MAPGFFGPWVTTDHPVWGGAYTTDYDLQAYFYGVFSCNHAEAALPYFDAFVEYAQRDGKHDAEMPERGWNCTAPGFDGHCVHIPTVMAPFGRGENAHGIYHNSDAIHSNAAFAALAFVNQFRYTRNATFLRETSWPFLRGVAAWFTYWFTRVEDVRPGGGHRYIVQNDCTAENCFGGAPPYGIFGCVQSLPHPGKATVDKIICGQLGRPACCISSGAVDVNTVGTIAFSRFILRHLIELADQGLVAPSAAELASWADILANLAPIPHGPCKPEWFFNPRTKKNTSICQGSPQVLLWSDPDQTYGGKGYWNNPLTNQPLFGVYPGEQIGMSSDPVMVEAAITTLTMLPPLEGVMPSNHGGNAWASAVRMGVNFTSAVETLLGQDTFSNGLWNRGETGFEVLGEVIAVTEMLLMSFEGFLRIFPAQSWPRGEDASFRSLRAVGGFLVSAVLASGEVSNVTVLSEAGRPCTVLSPFGDCELLVSTGGRGPVPTTRVAIGQAQGLWRFETIAGYEYTLHAGAT